MSLYDKDDAPTTLQDISNTLCDYACALVHDLRVLDDNQGDTGKRSHDIARLWLKVEDKAESLEYLADRLQEISHAFDIINKTVYNPNEEKK